MSSEQPPHVHLRCFFRFLLSQLHSVRSALEQALVTAHARAAEFIAWTKAVSRLPVGDGQRSINYSENRNGFPGIPVDSLINVTEPYKDEEFSGAVQFQRLCRNWCWHSSRPSRAPVAITSITFGLVLETKILQN